MYPSAAWKIGWKNVITPSAKLIPTKFLNNKSNTQIIMIASPNGMISLNVCERFGGTCSGILIVISLEIQKR